MEGTDAALVKHYLHTRSIKNPNAHEVFLTRCRKLKEVRNIGLKYVIFCSKLTIWAEHSSSDDWTLCKNELERGQLLSKVDQKVHHYCPQWFELLQKTYPRWNLESLSTEQPLSGLLGRWHGLNTEAKYSPFSLSEANLFPACMGLLLSPTKPICSFKGGCMRLSR